MIHDLVVRWNKSELLNVDTKFYILTRFNLKWPGRHKDEEQFQNWSNIRLNLFKDICIPGVRSQVIKPARMVCTV